jgi:hypothetical protein
MSEITLDQKVEFLKNIYLDYNYNYDDEDDLSGSALYDFYHDPENISKFALATSVLAGHATLTDKGVAIIEKYFDLVSKLDGVTPPQ